MANKIKIKEFNNNYENVNELDNDDKEDLIKSCVRAWKALLEPPTCNTRLSLLTEEAYVKIDEINNTTFSHTRDYYNTYEPTYQDQWADYPSAIWEPFDVHVMEQLTPTEDEVDILENMRAKLRWVMGDRAKIDYRIRQPLLTTSVISLMGAWLGTIPNAISEVS